MPEGAVQFDLFSWAMPEGYILRDRGLSCKLCTNTNRVRTRFWPYGSYINSRPYPEKVRHHLLAMRDHAVSVSRMTYVNSKTFLHDFLSRIPAYTLCPTTYTLR